MALSPHRFLHRKSAVLLKKNTTNSLISVTGTHGCFQGCCYASRFIRTTGEPKSIFARLSPQEISLASCAVVKENPDILSETDAVAIVTLEKVALFQDLDLENLNNKLVYYGFPQLDKIQTENALRGYRAALAPVIQTVQFSKIFLPDLYRLIIIIVGPTTENLATFLKENNIQNINDFVNQLDSSIRSLFIPVSENTAEWKTRNRQDGVALQLKNIRPDFRSFVGSVQTVIDNQIKTLTSVFIVEVSNSVDETVAHINSLNLNGFGQDVAQTVVSVLELLKDIIKEQLESVNGYVLNNYTPS